MRSLSLLAAGAAVTTSLLASVSAQVPAPKTVLDAFSLKEATVQAPTLPRTAGVSQFEAVVDLGGRRAVLQLVAHDVRADDFQLLVDDGQTIRALPRPVNTTYQGTIAGYADTLVAASLINGQLYATIRFEGATWGVEPISSKIVAMPSAAHVVYRQAAVVVPADVSCGVDTPNTTVAPISPLNR